MFLKFKGQSAAFNFEIQFVLKYIKIPNSKDKMLFSPLRDLRIHGDDHIQYSDPKFSLFFFGFQYSKKKNDKIIGYKKYLEKTLSVSCNCYMQGFQKYFFFDII